MKKRHNAIQALIAHHAIEDQVQLARLLKEEFGITAHQSIISRDLRTLGISKRPAGDTSRYVLPVADAEQALLPHLVQNITANTTLVVVHTKPGSAGFVAEYIDLNAPHIILGCIAGENTIFVAPKKGISLTHAVQELHKILHYPTQGMARE